MPENTIFTVNISFCGKGNRTIIGFIPTEVDLVFSIDDSGSMCKNSGYDVLNNDPSGKRFTDAIAFIANNLDPAKDYAGALIWNTGLKDSIALNNTNSFNPIKSKLNSWSPLPPANHKCGGGTDLAVGLEEAINLVITGAGTKIIIFISDGISDCSSGCSEAVLSTRINNLLTTAQNNGITIYTISLGSKTNAARLQQLAAWTGGAYYTANAWSDIAAIYEQIGENLYLSTTPINITIMDVLTSNVSVDQDTIKMHDTICTVTPTVEIINETTYIVAKNVDCQHGLNSSECVYLMYNASMVVCGSDLDIELDTASVFDGSKVSWTSFDNISLLGEVPITPLEINVTCPVVNFTLTKTTAKSTVSKGANVVYNFTLNNTGNVGLTLIWTEASEGCQPSCPTYVALGDVVQCSCSQNVYFSTTNNIFVSGSFAEYSLMQYASVTVNIGGVYLEKYAFPKVVTLDQKINYTYIITNVGSYPISLSGITLTDNQLGNINLSNCALL